MLYAQVTDTALTAFAVHDSGANIAVGTSDGACTILQLSSGLSELAMNEKSAVNNMFDRETQREKNLEKAIKEAKVGEAVCGWASSRGRRTHVCG